MAYNKSRRLVLTLNSLKKSTTVRRNASENKDFTLDVTVTVINTDTGTGTGNGTVSVSAMVVWFKAYLTVSLRYSSLLVI